MIINLHDTKLKITQNELNRYWSPFGRFQNISEVLVNKIWYKCGVYIVEKDNIYYVQISHPMLVDEQTHIIKAILHEGLYKEIPISKYKSQVLNYLLGRHPINHLSYNVRQTLYDRRGTVSLFLCAFFLSTIFYVINVLYDNYLIKLLADHTFVQTFFFFLTISGFIGIFKPFTINKELKRTDIKEIVLETLEENRRNKEIQKNATI